MPFDQEVPCRRQRQSAKLLIWLLLLSLCLPVWANKDHQKAANKPDSLRIGTWNLEWFRPDYRPDQPQRRSNKDFQALAAIIHEIEPDILAIQEASSETFLGKIINPDQYTTVLENRDNDQRAGFLIRKSIAWTRHPDLNLDLGHQGLRRGVHIEVPLKQGSLHLLSIHLASGCWQGSPDSSKKGCLRLKRQFPALKNWLSSAAKDTDQVVILGDFNRRLSRQDTLWKQLSSAAKSHHNLQLLTEQITSHCPSKRKPGRLIDHILLSSVSKTAPQVIEYTWPASLHRERHLSDHCPLYMDFLP
ncbi:endonuclease/exonuclease/phosphatase family protein [Parendozoicomonas haliclonae]|uniref:Endonuclease/Exonuclease/phosphatase family protein n=1 Tax=Parendozoicomonas haliclonae TaxID=1960125 RepID=A0A1X7AHI4_9GAMM|nr:endonuclease/exonuclease/phosphatase family protein [Parendozoicomonas haliclonae]SMA42901.1 Endonuclease/Exonuclease/phosphatase family protein [Parendozoicomonas haliclonae]